MSITTPTVLLIAFAIPTVLAVHWKSPNFKSFNVALQECAEYQRLNKETVVQYSRNNFPDQYGVRNLIHCTLINLNVWDKTTGIKEYAFRNFFQPRYADSCYENRTRACLQNIVAPISAKDQLIRTYRSFQCYYHNYGEISQGTYFLPYSNSARLQAIKDSLTIQNVPRSVLQQYAKGVILDSAEFPDAYYTFVIRIGVYDPQIGFLTGPLYTELGDPGILLEKTKNCEQSIRQLYFSEPAVVFEVFKQCYINYLPALPLFQKAASELLQESAV